MSIPLTRTPRVLVTGAGGFIGHHLVKALVARGCWVRGVDIKYPEYGTSAAHEFDILDLRRWNNCLIASEGIQEVYALAANMGGIGYITGNKAEIMHDNALINLHTLEAARQNRVRRYFFASSACIYPIHRQEQAELAPLRESEAYPAEPEDGYGFEKLFSERQCRHYSEDHGLETRVARFHNVFGPEGCFEGGREKAPAALCRKVALAAANDEIEIWGDGRQTRSYCYIDDCVEGILLLMRSGERAPLNLGSDRLVCVNELVDLISAAAEKPIKKRYDPTRPQGVRGRNSDNTRLRAALGWVPSTPLERGLEKTYRWIEGELRRAKRIR